MTTLDYQRDGYLIVRQLVHPEVVAHLAAYATVQRDARRFTHDTQVPGALRLYGDPAFDTLLLSLRSEFERRTSIELEPTYSFARIYRQGQSLVPHRDRAECEHSATVHIASPGLEKWPIHVKDRADRSVAIDLDPGDSIIYRGAELMHWRGPAPVAWYLQVFLHYVDRRGPFADLRLDGRTTLGVGRGTASLD